MVSRRSFLIGGGAAVGTAVSGLAVWQGLLQEHLEEVGSRGGATAPLGTTPGTTGGGATPASGRNTILVVLALNGGNDALNTLVPVGDGLYHDHRHDLAVSEDAALALAGSGGLGLHPALGELRGLWDAKRLAAAIGVGFDEQSRSHFAALDTWWSAMPGQARTTGWLGRWLDASADPRNPLTAVALGAGAPMLVGERATSTVILDPAGFSLRAPKGSRPDDLAAAFRATAAPVSAVPLAAAAQAALPATLDAVSTLAPALAAATDRRAARNRGRTQPGGAGGGAGAGTPAGAGEIATLLDVAADVIDLDIGTRVVVVAADGFDTHADQDRRHTQLLTDLSAGIGSFFRQIDEQGRTDQVLLMTTSEFGRRVAGNGGGTDHGKGGVELLMGAGITGGSIAGGYDLAGLDNGDLAVDIDTRSLYATALDWLGGPTDHVLGGAFPRVLRA